MNHEFQAPHVVEIPKVTEPFTIDHFGFPELPPIAGGSPELDEDYSIGIAEFAKNLVRKADGSPFRTL